MPLNGSGGRSAISRKLLTLVCTAAMALHASATGAQTPKLKTTLTLAGANNTADTLELQAAPGRFSRELDFYATSAFDPSPSTGRLAVTSLKATTAPGDVLPVKAVVANESAGGADGAFFDVSLAAADRLRVTIEADNLRAGVIYKSRIILNALKETREWEMTVTTSPRAVIAVDPIPALQFERSLGTVWCSWFGCSTPVGEFTFSFRNKTPFGAVTGLQTRFEPSMTTASKNLRSNFSIDSFSFRLSSNPLPFSQPAPSPAPGRQSGGAAASGAVEAPASACASPGPMVPISSLDKPIWISACVFGLKPGEYAGALRILANEAADDAADSRLSLAINVRDPRVLPIAVLILGSAIGWFTTKYLTAARKARDMARVVRQLRERADYLSRSRIGHSDWGFSDEAVSSGLVRVRVALKRLTTLTKDGMAMLVEESELTRMKDDAEMRLSKLEALRELRLQVERNYEVRPTIQQFVGSLLRDCSSLLDAPLFGATQQTTFGERLEDIKKWASSSTRASTYLAAIKERRNTEAGRVKSSEFTAGLDALVEKLVKKWPAAVEDKTEDVTLRQFDELFETLALINRDRDKRWAKTLIERSETATLRQLFELVDSEFWQMLDTTERKDFTINADQATVECYDIVRFQLSHFTIKSERLMVHPLKFVWTIRAPNETRVVETEDLTLVQYFSEPGTATVSVELRWSGRQPIVVADTASVVINVNPDYAGVHLFTEGGGLEYIAIAVAMAFAVVTAMQSQYDSTFGSATQYLALFLWAAGAASGGNILKQLGTTNSPGGQSDAALPARG